MFLLLKELSPPDGLPARTHPLGRGVFNETPSLMDIKLSFISHPAAFEFFQDQLSRAGHMTPMQWSDHHNAGFTSGIKSPWLPVSDDYPEVNVEVGNEFVKLLNYSRKKLRSVSNTMETQRVGHWIGTSDNCD